MTEGATAMTDQDNLRNRIASVVAERNAYLGGHTGRADPKAVAQAIIDAFGLTVETMTLGGMREEGAPFTTTRIVGKWVKQ